MIASEKELIEHITKIKNNLPKSSILLFRGENNFYEQMQSEKARTNVFINPEVENGWNTIVNRITESKSGIKHNQSILQHYGYATYYLDLTSDPLVAAWFSCNTYQELKPLLWIGNTLRNQNESTYNKIQNGIGYVKVLEIPNYKELIDKNILFDLTNEKFFLRPQAQNAYLILHQPPILPNANDYLNEIIEIDRNSFKSSFSQKQLFPSPNIDNGYKDLLDVPYVQLPSLYLKGNNDSISAEEGLNDYQKVIAFGEKAIPIPFYINDMNNREELFDYNPKWKDTTIYEPVPFRIWKTDNFNLSQIHKEFDMKIADTTKITISPLAHIILNTDNNPYELKWPQVNSNSIIFTKAVIDHDKVEYHNPPYYAIWLHKKDNLILELLLSSDENNIQIQLGHAYLLNDGELTPVKIENECNCGHPENHIEIIRPLLKIHSYNKNQKIALIQHPKNISNWYFVI